MNQSFSSSAKVGGAQLIDGKVAAAALRAQVGEQVALLKEATGITPGLAVVLVGKDPASAVYVRNKGKATIAAGMNSIEHRLEASTSQADLLALVDQLNKDPAVHGILVQLPLPPQIDADAVLDAIHPDKDVDGFHVINVGRLATNHPAALIPCTPYGCLMLLRQTFGNKGLSGQHAVIVGRSNIVGKPMAQLLLADHCTVSLTHSRTKDLADHCKRADIVVAAVGRPHFIPGDWIKPGAVVIDVGINRIDRLDENGKPDGTRLVGDVDFDSAQKVASAITPVPGGVGPMTIACLLRNCLIAASRRHDFSVSIS